MAKHEMTGKIQMKLLSSTKMVTVRRKPILARRLTLTIGDKTVRRGGEALKIVRRGLKSPINRTSS